MTAATPAPPTKGEFSQQLNQTFRALAQDGREFDLVLAEFVDVLDTETHETFTLLFKAPEGTPAVQMTYILSNSGIGEQHVFLVPVRHDADGTYFEAVYNRFKSPA